MSLDLASPVLNSLGYLGKQLYIGLNLIESVTASAVFNTTDVLRGEGLLRNVGDFAFDVALSGLFVVIDEQDGHPLPGASDEVRQ